MLVIDAPHFYAGLVLEQRRVVRAAPIVAYMVGWDVPRVLRHCLTKGWRVI